MTTWAVYAGQLLAHQAQQTRDDSFAEHGHPALLCSDQLILTDESGEAVLTGEAGTGKPRPARFPEAPWLLEKAHFGEAVQPVTLVYTVYKDILSSVAGLLL